MHSFIRKNSPTILALLGSAGVIGTTVLAVNATPKALKLLEKAEQESEVELTIVDKIKITGPVYIPAALVGVGTIACIWGSNMLNQKNQASLASAYMLLNQGYKEYRNKVVELHGEEMDEEIMDAIRLDHAKDCYIKCDSGFGFNVCTDDFSNMGDKILFYDENSKRFFEKSPVDVLLAEYHINRNLSLMCEVTLNMFYDFLGLDHIPDGDRLIWMPTDYYTWIDFSHPKKTLKDGTSYYVIETPYEPLPIEVLEEYYC